MRSVLAAIPDARIVGGAVRDALAERPVTDIDLATPEEPQGIINALQRAGIRAVPTGISHGTITAIIDGRGFEITTLRRDLQTDGRHAVVGFTSDWRADAARRDFTINAMSMTTDAVVFDFFGGIEDLRAGRIRFVGDPATRIAEDFLRILRFFRFAARYGRSAPDAATAAALADAAPQLERLSPERVWGELRRILAAPNPSDALALMGTLGVLDHVVVEGADLAAMQRLLRTASPADPILRLAALLGGDPDAFADRLRLSGAEREELLALKRPPVPAPADDDAALRRMLADEPASLLIGRTWLRGEDDAAWSALRDRLAAMPRPLFPLAGRDALALGLAPGPQVGALLRQVRAWWLAGGCVADAAACRAELARLARG
ncbi:MAG: CCA tRNA nucleotidyltransferase [Acetobacteraceae bacterium]|nr:CCA tRNA nucleotidyltransferase [Acetobacteraceae bacterium]